MTIDLDKLEQLEKEATPGPWYNDNDKFEPGIWTEAEEGYTVEDGYDTCEFAYGSPEDRECIAELRNAAPELIAKAQVLDNFLAWLDFDPGKMPNETCGDLADELRTRVSELLNTEDKEQG